MRSVTLTKWQAEAFDDREEMIIDYFFSPMWGIFATENSITPTQEADLIQHFGVAVPDLKIMPIELRLINTNFLEGQKQISAIQKFNRNQEKKKQTQTSSIGTGGGIFTGINLGGGSSSGSDGGSFIGGGGSFGGGGSSGSW